MLYIALHAVAGAFLGVGALLIWSGTAGTLIPAACLVCAALAWRQAGR